jgi:hypothetical protein
MSIRPAAPAVLVLAIAAATGLPVAAQQKPAATVDAAVAAKPGAAVATQSVKTSATIVAIDAATRSVTLKRQDGKVVTMDLGEEVRNFDQLKVGDKVQAEYVQAIALELKKGGGGTPGIAGGDVVKRSEPGQKPGGKATRQVAVLADVVAVDTKNRIVTLKGPGGNIVEMIVEDPERLKNVKKGDQVQALYSESLAVKVEPAGK